MPPCLLPPCCLVFRFAPRTLSRIRTSLLRYFEIRLYRTRAFSFTRRVIHDFFGNSARNNFLLAIEPNASRATREGWLIWGVYALLMSKPNHASKLYIGSGLAPIMPSLVFFTGLHTIMPIKSHLPRFVCQEGFLKMDTRLNILVYYAGLRFHPPLA